MLALPAPVDFQKFRENREKLRMKKPEIVFVPASEKHKNFWGEMNKKLKNKTEIGPELEAETTLPAPADHEPNSSG